MQGYSFTVALRMALANAREEAARLSHAHVAPEHILLGLTLSIEDVTLGALTKFNVDPISPSCNNAVRCHWAEGHESFIPCALSLRLALTARGAHGRGEYNPASI